jgi:hypothetical protein
MARHSAFARRRSRFGTVSIDLSNSVMMAGPGGITPGVAQQPAGEPLDLGDLSVYIGNGSTVVVGQPSSSTTFSTQ